MSSQSLRPLWATMLLVCVSAHAAASDLKTVSLQENAQQQQSASAFGACFNPVIAPSTATLPAQVGDVIRYQGINNLNACMCGNEVYAIVRVVNLTATEGAQSTISNTQTPLAKFVDIRVLPYGPQTIDFDICVLAARNAGSVCGAWRSQEYCERRYIRVNQPRVDGTLTVSPTELAVSPGKLGTVTINWSTTVATNAQLTVQSTDGSTPVTRLSTALSGQRAYAQVASGKTYLFRLSGNGQLIKDASVVARVGPSGTITATPATVTVPVNGTGTTVLEWNTQNTNSAEVMVRMNGQPPVLVARDPRGRTSLPWISAGHSYVFTLTPLNDPTNILSAVNVRGVAQIPPRPVNGYWYNPARGGLGLSLQRVGSDALSLTWLTYAASGHPIWYISNLTAPAGEWTGQLLEMSWNGSSATSRVVGSAKLIQSAGQWRYQWSLGTASGNDPIEPLQFGTGVMLMNLSGAWYNAQQPGWGITFNTQGKTQVAHLTLYAGGRPTWVQGAVDSTSTSVSFPLLYVIGTNQCPGCTGSPATSTQSVGSLTINSTSGVPSTATATSQIAMPGGTWDRTPFTLSRLTGP